MLSTCTNWVFRVWYHADLLLLLFQYFCFLINTIRPKKLLIPAIMDRWLWAHIVEFNLYAAIELTQDSLFYYKCDNNNNSSSDNSNNNRNNYKTKHYKKVCWRDGKHTNTHTEIIYVIYLWNRKVEHLNTIFLFLVFQFFLNLIFFLF